MHDSVLLFQQQKPANMLHVALRLNDQQAFGLH